MGFVLTPESAAAWAVAHGLLPDGAPVEAEELPGGVSAAVVALRGPDVGIVLKQALPQLRTRDEWLAKVERTETEAKAMRLCAGLTPGAVPAILANDPADHVVAMELIPAGARNWQAEIGAGRVHPECGTWAGSTLGTWHTQTAARGAVAAAFDDFEAFEQQRLRPFHETVMARRPALATAIAPYLGELREVRRCLVHGDYAAKNMLVGPRGRWVLDFEVTHWGNPVFDLGFFLSFVVLSAVHWPGLAAELESVAEGFLEAYARDAGQGFAGDERSVTGHTACLVLSRTDGTSPAQFLDDVSRERAREVGIALLERPGRGLWSWR
jgi:5-methylthioribose kinase